MKNLIKTLLTFGLLLALLCACNKAEKLDEQKDYILIKAIKSAQNQSIEDIDIDDLENYALMCEKKGENGKYCLANALIGYKLYLQYNYDKSMVHLKKAEMNLDYCDSIASFVYNLISKNLSTNDTLLALHYADVSLVNNMKYNNLRRLPYLYLNKSLLLKGDSSKFYLQKSLDLFNDWEDEMARSQYAYWHSDEMESDSIIAYMLPYYESVNFTGYASILANTYLKKGDFDSAYIYIDRLKDGERTKTDFCYRKSQLLTLKGDYKEACEYWEEAFDLLLEESKFMLNQRLGAINAEYDLLNAELLNEKRRVRMMSIYNVILLVLLALLSVAFVFLRRYKNDIYKKEMEITKRKERFDALFEKHKSDYKMDKDTVMTDALRNLEKLHEAYPSLTRTDVTIIWLLFMKYSSDTICGVLSITLNYYYQRKSAIYRTFGIKGKDEGQEAIERIVKEYIALNNNNKD